ncbi:MAG: SpoIIE family protein phosphatase [Dokdonella sp.]
MTAALTLELLEGPALPKRRWPLYARFGIGRAEGCDLQLGEPTISRSHALIEKDDDGWSLRDRGSLLGTHLNELPLKANQPAALRIGDVIGIGPWRFRVAPSAAVAAPVARNDSEAGTRISVMQEFGNLPEQRLELLLRYATEIATAKDENALADCAAEFALLGSGYARAAVLWRDGEDLRVASLRPETSRKDAFRFSRSLVASAENGELAILNPASGDDLARSQIDLSLRRALCAPLVLDGHAEAFLYLDSDRPANSRNADAPTFCHALSRLAALALANLQRIASERERATMTADAERAREVQGRLLPAASATIGNFSYALHLQPGEHVAGDIVDVFALAEGCVAVLLGDVSGTGLGAGLVMASVQSFLRAELPHHRDPALAMQRLNAHLCVQMAQGRFVTLWLGVFDPALAHCQFVDAGHGHALRVSGDKAVALSARGGIPLGIDRDARFEAESLTLAADEGLLLYSDGVIEQTSPTGDAFGLDGLSAALRDVTGPEKIVTGALRALREHALDTPPDDDTTLLAFGWRLPL